jgi:hypothetical protein
MAGRVSKRKLGWLLSLWLSGFGFASGVSALAVASPAAPLAVAAAPGALATRPATTHYTLAVGDLLPDKKPVTLRGFSDQLLISLPIPADWQPSDVALDLHGVASRALIDTSELTVAVNGLVVGQFGLGGGDGPFAHRIVIPAAQLHAGFNEVRIEAAHHSARACESSFGPELWSEIDLANSWFSTDAATLPAPRTLDHLNDAFDRTSWQRSASVTVLTIGAPAAAVMPALGLVAQGIGQRYSFLPVSIEQARAEPNWTDLEKAVPAGSQNAVLVATFAQLQGLLADASLPTNRGPLLALHPFSSDPSRLILLVAAADASQLANAATLFAMPQVPLPHSNWVTTSSIVLPSAHQFTARGDTTTKDNGAFPLSALNFHSTTLSGMNSPGIFLKVWSGSWQGRMQLRFHLSYPSGMAPQSALNVLVNGVLQSSIPLNDPAGGGYENYAVSIPSGALGSGFNTLQFQPVLIPVSNGGDCKPFFPGNLGLTVYQDTTLQKFAGSSLRRPDLALFAGSGGPYTDAPLGEQVALHLSDDSATTVGSAMTLMAKLSQISHAPLLKASFAVGNPEKAEDEIWIGPYASFPEHVRSRLSSSSPGQMIADVPLVESQNVPSRGMQWLARMRDWIGPEDANARQIMKVKVGLNGGFTNDAVAMNTIDSEGTLTAFTAEQGSTLQPAMARLVEYGPWSQLSGSLTVWSVKGDVIESVSSEEAPFSAFGLRGGLSIWFTQHPWLSLLLVGLMIAVMIYLTASVLRLYRRTNP